MNDETKQLEKLIEKCDMDKPYIFISYSKKDAERVYPMVIELQRLGYNIWIDTDLEDQNGNNWLKPALDCIADANCEEVFFMLSSNSLKSAPVFTEIMCSQYGTRVRLNHKDGHVLKIFDIDPEFDLANGKIETTIDRYIKRDRKPLEKTDYEAMMKVDAINDILCGDVLQLLQKKGEIACAFYHCLFKPKGGGNVLIGQYKDKDKDLERVIKNIPAVCNCSTPAAEPVTQPAEKAEQAISVSDTPVPERGVLDIDGGTYEGEIKDGCPNGKGKLTMKDGTIYKGTFCGNAKEGRGIIIYPNNYRKYKGEWDANGQLNGIGVLYYPEKKNTFYGRFENGVLNGDECKVKYSKDNVLSNKVLYVGSFSHGSIEQCTAAHPNGNIYSGEFIFFLPTGQSKVQYPNGDVYEGELKDWLPNGHGTMKKLVSQGKSLAVYSGNFTNGKLCDNQGKLEFYKLNEDGSLGNITGTYEGKFDNDIRNGHCKYTPYSDKGKSYDGEWENNQRSGHGVETYPDGSVYDGEFKASKPHGHGVLKSSDGTVIQEGEWENGKFIG